MFFIEIVRQKVIFPVLRIQIRMDRKFYLPGSGSGTGSEIMSEDQAFWKTNAVLKTPLSTKQVRLKLKKDLLLYIPALNVKTLRKFHGQVSGSKSAMTRQAGFGSGFEKTLQVGSGSGSKTIVSDPHSLDFPYFKSIKKVFLLLSRRSRIYWPSDKYCKYQKNL